LKKILRLRVFGVEKNSPTRIAYSSQITARSHDLDWPSAFAALRVSAQLRSPSLALAISAPARWAHNRVLIEIKFDRTAVHVGRSLGFSEPRSRFVL
jgi:hypothetical protein